MELDLKPQTSVGSNLLRKRFNLEFVTNCNFTIIQAEACSAAAAAAFFFAKYSSARARFLATDGLTHFFRPGNTVREQPAASSFSFAADEKARALIFSFTLSSPSAKI